MNSLVSELFVKFERLQSSNFVSFEEVTALKNVMGVYMIFNEKEDLIYIRKTNKFNIRFGTDLKHESTHTLVKKLIKLGGLPNRFGVKDFLMDKCMMRIEICRSNREAEALEHIAIYVLNPLYNKL